jgi:hypothetical protein
MRGGKKREECGSRQQATSSPITAFHRVQCLLNNIEVRKRKIVYSIDRDEVGSRLRLSI